MRKRWAIMSDMNLGNDVKCMWSLSDITNFVRHTNDPSRTTAITIQIIFFAFILILFILTFIYKSSYTIDSLYFKNKKPLIIIFQLLLFSLVSLICFSAISFTIIRYFIIPFMFLCVVSSDIYRILFSKLFL